MEHQVNRMIPLGELEISRENARRQDVPAQEHAELVASIESLGLLNNLVVRARREKKTGVKYSVIAGGRRLRALQDLWGQGKWPADKPVACSVISDGNQTEISLHENIVRTHMHAVDEYEAYRQMTQKGLTAADIASRLGITVQHVNRFLRLANVHEDILEAARGGEIDEEALMAFATTSDQSRQLQVWNDVRAQHGMPPTWIKREILAKQVSASHPRVRFLGLEAYESAGGQVDRDLFSADEDAYITDVKLLDQLVLDKLNTAAQKLRDAWKWVDTTVNCDWNATEQYGRIEGRRGALTQEEEVERERLEGEINANETRIEELEALCKRTDNGLTEDEEDDARVEIGNLWNKNAVARNEVSQTLRLAREQRAIFDPAQMKHAGVIVTIDSDGHLYQHMGLVRTEDAKGLPAPAAVEAEPGEDGEATGPGESLTPGYRPPTRERPRTTEQDVKTAAGLSQTLCDQLETIRMNIVKLSLGRDFDAAFDLLTFQLCRRVLTRMTWGEECLQINAGSTATHTMGAGTGSDGPSVFATTEEQLENETKALPLEWLDNDDRLTQFEAFSKLPTRTKQALFAAAVAQTLKAQLSFEPRAERTPEVEAVIQRLDVPLAKHYRPNAKHFWERVKKSDALAVAEAVLGPEWSDAHAKDRRPELAEALEKVFTAKKKPIGINDAQWTAVQAWTPPGFQAFDRQGLDPKRKVGDNTTPPVDDYENDDETLESDSERNEDGDTETDGAEAPTGFDRTPAAVPPAFLQD